MSKKKQSARAKKSTPVHATGPMNLDLLAEITRLMKENDLNTVDVRDGDRRIVLKRGAPVAPTYAAAPAPQAMPAPVAAATGGPVTAPPPSAPDSDADLIPIKSPMVGTVYLKPAPDARQYVSTGAQVGPETVVCLIEAMKVFNEIKAETSGTVVKIVVTDGQTVEFGQPLFYVKH